MSALDLSWVSARLAVGGRFPRDAASELARRLRIRSVVDVRKECCDDVHALTRFGIELLHLPTEDARALSQGMLDQGVAWVSSRLSRGHGVLVHCEYGIGRSALLALCIQVHRGAMPLHAMERLKAVRPRVSPSPEQLEAFLEWCRRGDRPAPPRAELERVAYRHLS